MPAVNPALPELYTVECIPADKGPFGRELYFGPRPEVHDVEDAPCGGHHGIEAGHVVVVSRPGGRANPLQVVGWANLVILCDSVVAGAVQVVGPFVDVFGPWFNRPAPAISPAQEGDSAWGQDALDLLLGERFRFLDDQEVDLVVDERQGITAPLGDGKVSVVRAGCEAFPGLAGAIQGEEQEVARHGRFGVVGQCCGQRAVAAAGVDNQATVEVGQLE